MNHLIFPFNFPLSRTAPDSGTTIYSYDQAGNLLTATDAKSQTSSFTYDALNRPISQSYGGTNLSFIYDQGPNAIGKLSRITDAEGTVDFTYDSAGRVAQETRVVGATTHIVDYSWDATTGDLAGMTYPSGLNLTYARDAAGQVNGLLINNLPLVFGITRLPFGPWTSLALDSVVLTRDYDQRYNTTRIKAGTFDYIYTRDLGGRVTTIANHQVPTVATGQSDLSYNPDNNQLNTMTGAVPKTCTYDANGNMLSDGTHTFVYDGLNRIIQVEDHSGMIATYGYDSSNGRIRKTVGSTTTHYLYDLNSQLIAETAVDGTPLREYIYLDGEPIAVKEYQSNPGTYYYINDHLGTPQRLVDDSGAVVWRAAYLPFGKTQIAVETVQNNLRFPGQYYDAETGLHYNWHRFYDPTTGRYISADPIGLAGEDLNLYSYVGQDPINWYDPDGLARKGNKGDGSATGKNTTNPYKHCKQHPTKPNMLQCKDKRTGKKKDVPKPPDWDANNQQRNAQQSDMCEDECEAAMKTAAVLGGAYVVYKIGKTCVLTAVGGPVGFAVGVATP